MSKRATVGSGLGLGLGLGSSSFRELPEINKKFWELHIACIILIPKSS